MNLKLVIEMMTWKMQVPQPFGLFHIVTASVGISIAIVLAYYLRACSDKMYCRLMFSCAFMLLIFEIMKQYIHYFILNDHQYNWWIFPFQLCTLPMYLCLFMPWIKSTSCYQPIETFLMDFNLLGGIMALLFPYDLLHPQLFLTLHAFLWHIILVFIGFLIGFSHHGNHTWSGFKHCLIILFIAIIIATIFNILFHSFGTINLFYISPYQITSQPFFHSIALQYGNTNSNICYIVAMIAGGALIHFGFQQYAKDKSN